MCFFGRCLPCLLHLAQFFVDLGFDSPLRINKSRSCLSPALPTFWVILITLFQELSIPLATRAATLDPIAGLPWKETPRGIETTLAIFFFFSCSRSILRARR
jgi:hypothetical protein